jgi:hypothetical protein
MLKLGAILGTISKSLPDEPHATPQRDDQGMANEWSMGHMLEWGRLCVPLSIVGRDDWVSSRCNSDLDLVEILNDFHQVF